MIIATEALKLEACTGAEACSRALLGASFPLRRRCFTSLFPHSVVRAWSHPVSHGQCLALARHWAPAAPRQSQGHSQCRGTAQGANLETAPAKAESELLGLDICQIKKKNEPTSSHQGHTIKTLQIQNIQYPRSSFLKRGWNLGYFTDNRGVLFQNTKRVRERHSSLQVEPEKRSPGLPHKNLLCPFPAQPFTCPHPQCKKMQRFFSVQLSWAKQFVCYCWAYCIWICVTIKWTHFDQIFLEESPCLLDLFS